MFALCVAVCMDPDSTVSQRNCFTLATLISQGADTFGRQVTEIDPGRNAVARTIETGVSPEGLVSNAGELWVAAHGS